jgi:hypothetical protein
MLAFTSDRFSIAPFLPAKRQEALRKSRAAGAPVHVSQQPWGVWGPMMTTYFTHELGLQDKVQPLAAFYPVPFPDRSTFLRAANKVEALLSEETTALHLWASNKKQIGTHFDGLPPPGSYLERLVRKHAINPALAPVKGRGSVSFDGALMDHPDIDDVASVADLTGGSRSFVLALQHKFDCDVFLIDTDRAGHLGGAPQDWIAPYTEFLTQNGVDEDKIKAVAREKDLRPVDVLCNLKGFGDHHKVPPLRLFLERCMNADTRLFMDIRKNSGAFPFLRDFGTNQLLSTHEEDGKPVSRVMVTPKPPQVSVASGDWDRIAEGLAGKDGFYWPGPAGHSFLYMPRSKDVLVVTFDNLDIAMTKRDDRRPWGHSLIEAQGWSMLGVLAGGWTWYREPWVCEQFDALRDSGFFAQFRRVVFYGASMGGYAACAFSSASPGSDVVAISPQSTLDKSIVPWETRYKVAWDRDFSGGYGDAAKVSQGARQVSILFDPYEPLDAQHAARFDAPNVQRLRTPLLGHRLGSSLNQMGILSPIILGALSGSLTELEFYKLLQKRKSFPRYQRELFERALQRGHVELARSMAKYVLARNENRAIQRRLKDLGSATPL